MVINKNKLGPIWNSQKMDRIYENNSLQDLEKQARKENDPEWQETNKDSSDIVPTYFLRNFQDMM